MVTPDKTNYMRCRLAVDDVLTQIMRKYMEQIGTPTASKNLKLTEDEMHAIKTFATDGFEHFDISFMYKIARNNMFPMPISDKPTRGWGPDPPSVGQTVGDNAERIRKCRNAIAHLDNPSISEKRFLDLFSRFKDIAKRADQHLQTHTFVRNIQQYQLDTLDKEMEDKYTKMEEKYQKNTNAISFINILLNSMPVTVFQDHLTSKVIENLQRVGQKEGVLNILMKFFGVDNAEYIAGLLNSRGSDISTESIAFHTAEEGCLALVVDIEIGLFHNDEMLKEAMKKFIQRVFEVAAISREKWEVLLSVIGETDRYMNLKTNADIEEYQTLMTKAQAPAPQEVDHAPQYFKKQKKKCFELYRDLLLVDGNEIVETDFICEEIGRPLTNHVYKCTWKSNIYQQGSRQTPSPVLVRIYGEIAREDFPTFLIKNLVVFNILAERNLGPKCYGFSQEGRIEELYTCDHLQRLELKSPFICNMIARKLAKIHAQDMPLTKTPTFLSEFCTPRIANIQKRIKDIEKCLKDRKISEDTIKKIVKLKFGEELTKVVVAIDALKPEVVFSHNGLTEGDILYLTEAAGKDVLSMLKIIDFEYCAYNYRAYDLSMLFIENCIEYRNVQKFPWYAFHNKDHPSVDIRKQICKAYLVARSETGQCTPNEVDSLFHETEICELAVHLMWTIWGFDQHLRGEKIYFGYLEYAADHLLQYEKKSSELLQRKRDDV